MIGRKMFGDSIFKYYQHFHSPAHYTIQRTFQLKQSNNSTILVLTGFPLRCGSGNRDTCWKLVHPEGLESFLRHSRYIAFETQLVSWWNDETRSSELGMLTLIFFSPFSNLDILPLNPVARVVMLLGNTTFENCRAQIGGAISSKGWCFCWTWKEWTIHRSNIDPEIIGWEESLFWRQFFPLKCSIWVRKYNPPSKTWLNYT